MRRSSIRFPAISSLLLGVLAVAACQGEGAEQRGHSTVGPTPVTASDDVEVTTPPAPTTETPSETTAARGQPTTSAPVAPTTEDATHTAEGEVEETESDEPVAADVIVVQDSTVFTTPAQAAFCSLSASTDGMAAAVSCEVTQSSVPAGEELLGACPSAGYGWYFNFFEDVGHGGFGCNFHDGIVHTAGVDLADEPWVDQGHVHVLPSGTRVPILDYGRVLQAGSLSCTVQPDGLTCASSETGRGFTVNTASYVAW